MKEGSLKIMETWDVWPLPSVQDTSAVNDEIRMIVKYSTGCKVLNTDSPLTGSVIPRKGNDSMSKFDIFLSEVVLSVDRLEIFPDLG